MEDSLNGLNSESLKAGLKLHKEKTRYMTNHAGSEDTLIGQEKMKKWQNRNTSDKPNTSKDATKEETYARIRAAWSCVWKKGNPSR